MIDCRYPSNRPLQQWLASLPGAGYGQFEHKADSLIAKFKEAGGTVREIDVWAESPRLSPLWLSASSSACHGLLIITVITPLPTKPSATKMPENWSWRTRQLLTCRWYAWCCCAPDVLAALRSGWMRVMKYIMAMAALTPSARNIKEAH